MHLEIEQAVVASLQDFKWCCDKNEEGGAFCESHIRDWKKSFDIISLSILY